MRVNEWFSAYATATRYGLQPCVDFLRGLSPRQLLQQGKTHDVLTGSDDGRHSATRLWRGELACSLTRPNPWPLMIAAKAPARGDWRTDGFIVGGIEL